MHLVPLKYGVPVGQATSFGPRLPIEDAFGARIPVAAVRLVAFGARIPVAALRLVAFGVGGTTVFGITGGD